MLVLIGIALGLAAAARFSWVATEPITYWGDHTDQPDRNWNDFWGLFARVGAIGIVVGAVVGVLFSVMVYEVTLDDAPRRFDIVALGDGSGVEGRAFLGSGTVDTEAVFFYYAPRADGGYGLFHVDANITSIYEDQTADGYMIKYCEDSTTYAKWIDFPVIDIFGEPSEADRYDCSYAERVEFHIPANSIDRSFNLDAQ